MSSFQKIIIAFMTVITIAVFAFVFWLYSGAWNKPLGPTLRIPTATEFSMPPTWTPVSNSEAALVSTPGTVVNAVQAISSATSVAPTEAPATTAPAVTALCGGPPVMTILAVGTDARGNNYDYGLGDVIRLVRVDFVNPKVTVLEFPRDLWVEIPDIADNINGQD